MAVYHYLGPFAVKLNLVPGSCGGGQGAFWRQQLLLQLPQQQSCMCQIPLQHAWRTVGTYFSVKSRAGLLSCMGIQYYADTTIHEECTAV